MEARGHDEIVRAEVPMAEMLGYATDLRAMTGGRGDYAMEFDHYAQVPGPPRGEGDAAAAVLTGAAAATTSAPMLVAQLLAAVERLAPTALAEEWDNVGLLVGRSQPARAAACWWRSSCATRCWARRASTAATRS